MATFELGIVELLWIVDSSEALPGVELVVDGLCDCKGQETQFTKIMEFGFIGFPSLRERAATRPLVFYTCNPPPLNYRYRFGFGW